MVKWKDQATFAKSYMKQDLTIKKSTKTAMYLCSNN